MPCCLARYDYAIAMSLQKQLCRQVIDRKEYALVIICNYLQTLHRNHQTFYAVNDSVNDLKLRFRLKQYHMNVYRVQKRLIVLVVGTRPGQNRQYLS